MAALIWANLSSNRCLTSCPNLRVFFAPIQGWILWSAFYSCATSWPEHEPCRGLPPKSLPLLYTLLLSAPRSHSSASVIITELWLVLSLFFEDWNAKAIMLDTPCLVLHETSLAVWCLHPYLSQLPPKPCPQESQATAQLSCLQWLRREGEVPLGPSCLS